MNSKLLRVSIATTLLALWFAGCGGGVQGTYSDQTGAFVLQLNSGGQATFTFAGQSAPCAYTANGNAIALNCQGAAGSVNLTVQSDGSLTGPPGTLMPPLRKK